MGLFQTRASFGDLMAIYHLNHRPIGKSTHRSGYAAAHARYILRDQAATCVLGDLPNAGLTRAEVARWFNQREQTARANARVADRLVLALPLELGSAARIEIVRNFVARVDPGARCPWVAAVHDQGEDAANPHAHLMLVDADKDTGKRVLMLSERKSTERLRLAWETSVNHILEREGLDIRVDRRSLKEQGVQREPQIHVGPAGSRIMAKQQHERTQQNHAVMQANAIVADLEELSREESLLDNEIDQRISEDAVLWNVMTLQGEVLEIIEGAIEITTGDEYLAESDEDDDQAQAAQADSLHRLRTEIIDGWHVKFKSEDEKTYWKALRKLIDKAQDLSDKLTTIIHTGVRVMYAAIDDLGIFERFHAIEKATQQVIDDLGERYTATDEKIWKRYRSESLGVCRVDDFRGINLSQSEAALQARFSEVFVHYDLRNAPTYASAVSVDKDGNSVETRLDEQQLERIKMRMRRSPVIDFDRDRDFGMER